MQQYSGLQINGVQGVQGAVPPAWGFYPHTPYLTPVRTAIIRDETDFAQHWDYIHYNPVHHHRCQVPTAWQCSREHRFIAQGIYPPDWGDRAIPLDLDESCYE